MGLSFLAPVFLAGLAAVAVPVLVHLTHRERKDPVHFPSLMFVRRVPHRVRRRQRIRNWLIFALRIGALTLLALAFARPLLRDRGGVAAVAGAREVVVLLDRSHSMGYADRWSRGLDAVRSVVDALGSEDRATLIFFDERAEAVTPPTSDRAVLLAALDGAELSDAITAYGPAIQLAREVIQSSDRSRSLVVIVSDFQRSGWDPAEAARFPATTAVQTVDVSRKGEANIAITGLSLSRGRVSDREVITAMARVTNFGPDTVKDVPVFVELGGQEVQRLVTDLAPGSSERMDFNPLTLATTAQRGLIRAGSDPLPEDNRFHFLAAPARPLQVLVVESRATAADPAPYLLRALQIGYRPEFVVSRRSVAALRPTDLADIDVVILHDAPYPGGAVGRRLEKHLVEGGGALVVLGSRTGPSDWSAEGLDLLPVGFGSTVDRPDGTRLGHIDYDHPALRPFRAPRSGDFATARFFRHRRMEAREDGSVLARFEDGSPALVEGVAGTGRIMVLSSGLGNFWNDLVVQPVFLPFLHQVVKHLAGYREARPWFEVGSVVELSAATSLWEEAREADSELVVETPAGERRVRRPRDDSPFLRLDEAGFYEVRIVGAASGAALTLAVNLDPQESDLASVDAEEVAVAVVSPDAAGAAEAGMPVLSPEERERRQGMWWYLLAAAGGLLLLEIWLANRASRRARSRLAT